jgi:hypothetical protein
MNKSKAQGEEILMVKEMLRVFTSPNILTQKYNSAKELSYVPLLGPTISQPPCLHYKKRQQRGFTFGRDSFCHRVYLLSILFRLKISFMFFQPSVEPCLY